MPLRTACHSNAPLIITIFESYQAVSVDFVLEFEIINSV